MTWGCGLFHSNVLRCLRESASAGLQELLAAVTKREVWGELPASASSTGDRRPPASMRSVGCRRSGPGPREGTMSLKGRWAR